MQQKFQKLQHVLLPKQHVPPNHFEQFLHQVMRVLGFTETPVSYACQMFYQRVLESIAQIQSNLDVIKEENASLRQNITILEQKEFNARLSQVSVSNVNLMNQQQSVQSLQKQNYRQQKIVLEYYQLLDDFGKLKEIQSQQQDENMILKHFIQKLQIKLDHSVLEKIKLTEDYREIENEYLTYKKCQIISSEQLQTSMNNSICELTNKVQTLQSINKQTTQVTRSQSSQNLNLTIEIKRLQDSLEQAYFENENLQKAIQFKEDEVQSIQGTDSAVAFRRLKKQLNDIVDQKTQEIDKLQQQIKIVVTTTDNQIYINEQEFIKSKNELDKNLKLLKLEQFKTSQLEDTIYNLQQEKEKLIDLEKQKILEKIDKQNKKLVDSHNTEVESLRLQINQQVEKINLLYSELDILKVQLKLGTNDIDQCQNYLCTTQQLEDYQQQLANVNQLLEKRIMEIDSLIISKNETHGNLQKLQIKYDDMQEKFDIISKNIDTNVILVQELDSKNKKLSQDIVQLKQRHNIYDLQQKQIIQSQREKLVKVEEQLTLLSETAQNAVKYKQLADDRFLEIQALDEQLLKCDQNNKSITQKLLTAQSEINMLQYHQDILIKNKTQELEIQIEHFNNLLDQVNNESSAAQKQLIEQSKELHQQQYLNQTLNQQLGQVELLIQQNKNDFIIKEKTYQVNIKKLERETQDLKIKCKAKQLYQTETILEIDDEALFKLICFIQTLIIYFGINIQNIDSVLISLMSKIQGGC